MQNHTDLDRILHSGRAAVLGPGFITSQYRDRHSCGSRGPSRKGTSARKERGRVDSCPLQCRRERWSVRWDFSDSFWELRPVP